MDYSLLQKIANTPWRHMERESGDEVWDKDGKFVASCASKDTAALIAFTVNNHYSGSRTVLDHKYVANECHADGCHFLFLKEIDACMARRPRLDDIDERSNKISFLCNENQRMETELKKVVPANV